MSLDIAAGENPAAPLPLQYIDIQLTPVIGGQISVFMQATLLDEEELRLVGEDLLNERVNTLDHGRRQACAAPRARGRRIRGNRGSGR